MKQCAKIAFTIASDIVFAAIIYVALLSCGLDISRLFIFR